MTVLTLFFFISVQVFFTFFFRKIILFILFNTFSNKIKIFVVPKKNPPVFKNKELKRLIKENEFEYIGTRVEQVFKVFKNKYHLFKNSDNNYLDVTGTEKFFYFSYKRDNKYYFYFSDSIQIKSYEDDKVKIHTSNDFSNCFLKGDEVDRIELSNKYYEFKSPVLAKSIKYFIYPLLVFYIAQFIYFFVKWVL